MGKLEVAELKIVRWALRLVGEAKITRTHVHEGQRVYLSWGEDYGNKVTFLRTC